MKIKISCICVSIHFWPTTIISLARAHCDCFVGKRLGSSLGLSAAVKISSLTELRSIGDDRHFPFRSENNIQLPASLQQSVYYMHFLPLKSTTRDDAVYCYWAKYHHASKSHRIYSAIYLSAMLNSCHHQTKPDTDEEQTKTTRRPRKVCLVERENFISLISPRHPSSRRYDTLSPTKPRPDHHNNIHIRRLTRRWSPRSREAPKI